MDSPSNLFSNLDLTERNLDSRFKDMDDMDIDTVYEVADTSESNSRMGFRRKAHSRHRREPHRHVMGGGSTVSNDTEQQLRRERLVQLINESLESNERPLQAHDEILEFEPNTVSDKAAKSVRSSERSSTIHGPVSYHNRHRGPMSKKGKEKYPVFDGGDAVLKSRGKGREFDLSRDSFQYDASRRNLGQRRLGHNRFITPCSSVKSRIQTEVGGQNIGDVVYDQGDAKGADTSSISQTNSRQRQGHLRQLHFASLPYNMAQGKNTTKDYTAGTMISDACVDGNSSQQYNVSPDSEFMLADKKKGKMILGDNTLSNAQYSEAKLHSDRLCSMKGKEETYFPDDYSALKSSEDIAWISPNVRSKGLALVSQESASVSKREGNSSHLSDSKHKSTMAHGDYVNLVDNSQSEPIESVGWQRRRRFMKGKRNHKSILSSYDGDSNSNFENTETSNLQPPRHISTRLSRDSQNYVKVDELQSLQLRCKNLQEQATSFPDPSSTSINQVESDEILARQLQEQFYDELAGSAGTEEMDATLAWSLQEEDARRAASTLNQSDNREASMAHLYSYYAQLPFRNSSARLSNRAQARMSNRRRNFNSSEIDLEIRMMEEMTNFSAMESGRRRNFLDALEAAFDHSNDALEGHHDFNENDYEMLLALDDNIHQHVGASEIQINSLPQSIIQSDNSEEPCAICLENLSVGETIRHLPCLHKFHKECIDTWLSRRIWCPICKCEIT